MTLSMMRLEYRKPSLLGGEGQWGTQGKPAFISWDVESNVAGNFSSPSSK